MSTGARAAKALPEEAGKVVHEVAAGAPGSASRRWLGWVSLVALILFVIDTFIVLNGTVRTSFDIPVEHAVQSFPWGPLTWIMTLTNESSALGGQYLLGAVAVLVILVIDRRAGSLMALGSIASLFDNVLKISIQRHRPEAGIVHILDPSVGYSYPSGHAVFFTWLCFMLAFSLAPRLRPPWRRVLWTGATIVIFLACMGRVWAGAHWPTDVIGGFLLGIAWSAFVLWLPERWLPAPNLRWVPGRRRKS